MQDILTSQTGAAAIAITVMFICVALMSVGCSIAVQWRKARQVEVEGALKKEMLERGMSADDIVKVLGASCKTPDESIVVELAKQGMSADDIVKVLQSN